MKTIKDYANKYIGRPQVREAYESGMNKSFELIRHEINVCMVNQYKFPILHLLDFMDKMQGRKEAEK